MGKNIAGNEQNIELPNECIVEILLGKSMSQKDKDEVKKMAKEKYPKAKIVECCYLNNTFELFFFKFKHCFSENSSTFVRTNYLESITPQNTEIRTVAKLLPLNSKNYAKYLVFN